MKTFLIELNEQHLQVLGAALGEVPFRVAEPVVRQLNEQIQKQLENTIQKDFEATVQQ